MSAVWEATGPFQEETLVSDGKDLGWIVSGRWDRYFAFVAGRVANLGSFDTAEAAKAAVEAELGLTAAEGAL